MRVRDNGRPGNWVPLSLVMPRRNYSPPCAGVYGSDCLNGDTCQLRLLRLLGAFQNVSMYSAHFSSHCFPFSKLVQPPAFNWNPLSIYKRICCEFLIQRFLKAQVFGREVQDLTMDGKNQHCDLPNFQQHSCRSCSTLHTGLGQMTVPKGRDRLQVGSRNACLQHHHSEAVEVLIHALKQDRWRRKGRLSGCLKRKTHKGKTRRKKRCLKAAVCT